MGTNQSKRVLREPPLPSVSEKSVRRNILERLLGRRDNQLTNADGDPDVGVGGAVSSLTCGSGDSDSALQIDQRINNAQQSDQEEPFVEVEARSDQHLNAAPKMPEVDHQVNGAASRPPPVVSIRECAEIDVSPKLQVYNNSDIVYGQVLGEGVFGIVLKATIKGKSTHEIAVKLFNAHLDRAKTIRHLNTVIKLMHRNVVPVVGLIDQSTIAGTAPESGPRVLYEYFPEGNLLQLVSGRKLDLEILLKLFHGVSQGCEYLHSQGVVHGNLTARNILVEKVVDSSAKMHYNAKVTDYGIIQLATANGVGEHYRVGENGLVGFVRHVPPELLHPDVKEFTCKSDVWSFGVLIWEALTRGGVPYGKDQEKSNVVELVKSGRSPYDLDPPQCSIHASCICGIVEVMKLTFKVNPEERPSFSALTELISEEMTKKQDGIGCCHAQGDNWKQSILDEFSCLEAQTGENRNRRRPPRNTGSSPWRASRGRRRSDVAPGCRQSRGSSRYPRKYESREDLSQSTSDTQDGPSTEPLKLDSQPEPLMSVTAPPPPYSSRPLPNHRALRGTRSGRMRYRSPPRRPPRSPTQVDYDKEIARKVEELDGLKVRKLQQEASNAMSKMQSLVTQITSLQFNASVGYTSSRSGPSDNGQQETGVAFNRRGGPSRSYHSTRGGRGSKRGAKKLDFGP